LFSVSQVAGITGMSYYAWLQHLCSSKAT
jgi:hypothetical protein